MRDANAEQVPMKKVQYVHFREMVETPEGKQVPNPHGGATVCYLPGVDSHRLGVTIAAPNENFNRSEGRNKAEGRCRMLGNLSFYGLLTMDQFIEISYSLMRNAEARVAAVHERRPRNLLVWVRSAHVRKNKEEVRHES